MNRRDFTLSGLISFGFLAGCAGQGLSPQPPQVALQGVNIRRLSFAQANFGLDMLLTNPNGFTLPIDGLDLNLALANLPIGTSSLRNPLTLRPNIATPTSMDVQTNPLKLLEVVPQLLNKGQGARLPYALDGRVRVAGIPIAIPWSTSGFVPMRFL